MKLSSNLYRVLFNLYPPYLGAGIKITHISSDWRKLDVKLYLRWYNKNIVGVHFGGSLYSMVDPHLMLLIMKSLGNEYIVWDKKASIDFIKASKKNVTAKFLITDSDLEDIKEKTKNGEKYLKDFIVETKDDDGNIVSRVIKTIYIRKKMSF